MGVLHIASVEITSMIRKPRSSLISKQTDHSSNNPPSSNQAIEEYFFAIEVPAEKKLHPTMRKPSNQRIPPQQQQRHKSQPSIQNPKFKAKRNVTPIYLQLYSSKESFPTAPPYSQITTNTPPSNTYQERVFSKTIPKFDQIMNRLSSHDTGRSLWIPVSEFSMHQGVPVGAVGWYDSRDFVGKATGEKYFQECGLDRKRDLRFTDPSKCVNQSSIAPSKDIPKPIGVRHGRGIHRNSLHGQYPRQQRKVPSHDINIVNYSLITMLAAWSEFAERERIVWWISHGELLGWFWNAKLLPWDTDLDIQVSTAQLLRLIEFNQTLIRDRFLIDINPNLICRTFQENNVIDARVVDTESGYMIDITGLSMVLESKNLTSLYCKSPHSYQYDDLMPLRETTLEGIHVWRPNRALKVLIEEYRESALIVTRHRPYSSREAYEWDHKSREWIRLRKQIPRPARIHS
ncbi:LicD family-domain-containing protein [Obelidium mucronatum]|nr:LicD family-domain-containing protein [Obelidium mucronatum]